MKFLLFCFFIALFDMANSQSDFSQAVLHNIDNTITEDNGFDYADFENDIGGNTTYRTSVTSGHIITYTREDGFGIYHPDVDGEVSVESVMQAYRNTYNSNFGAYTSRISNNYLVQFSSWQSNIFKRLDHEENTLPDYDPNYVNSTYTLDKRGQYRCSNSNQQASCGQNFASGNKIKSAHNCKNAGGKGYSCTFPQGSFDYGTCCYKMNVALSCNYEGGGCLSSNPSNTCGTGCKS